MMPESEENRLDQTLRDKFDDFELPPGAPVWTGIAQRLEAAPPPAPRVRPRPLPLPFLFGLTALLAGLGGWLLPHEAPKPVAVVAPRAAVELLAPAADEAGSRPTRKAGAPVAGVNSPAPTARREPMTPAANASAAAFAAANPRTVQPVPNAGSPALAAQTPLVSGERVIAPGVVPGAGAKVPGLVLGLTRTDSAATTAPTAETATTEAATAAARAAMEITVAATARPETVPATLRTLAALEHQALGQLPSIATLAPGPDPTSRRAALLTTLRAERAELFRLQRRTDTLLLALGDLPGAPLAAPAAATAAAATATDSARPRPLAHRWSLLLTAAPEQNALSLQGPEGDSLTALRRNQETGRTGFSAALGAEYRLTPRLSVGGGVGFSTFGTDLRITNKNTAILVRYDTATTRTTTFFTSTNQTYSIRITQLPQLSPVFNGNGQVIRYDTVYVPRRDTVFTTTVQRDSTHAIRRTITPNITRKETLSTQRLQPNYRFFTVPVLLRYRLTMGPGRWWADATAGAQLQFFLGGTQVVTSDGENFRTETIAPGNGPFRALNVALSGSLALNYALSNRLSVSVAPSLRWQALSVYRAETGLRQQPTATGLMLGVRFRL